MSAGSRFALLLVLAACAQSAGSTENTSLRIGLRIVDGCRIETAAREGGIPRVDCSHRQPYAMERRRRPGEPAPRSAVRSGPSRPADAASWLVTF